MDCPYCGVSFSIDGVRAHHMIVNFSSPYPHEIATSPDEKRFTISAHYCPECLQQVMWLNEISENELGDREVVETSLLYPKYRQKLLSSEVPGEYAQEFREAFLNLEISPKASAALSRRTLQRLIREKEGIEERTLFREIERLLALNKLPTYLAQDLDAIRHVGNFAAHPLEDQITGEIMDVEPGEAEWTLEVLEALLTFYFVDAAKSVARRSALNEKLRRAGKKPMLEE